MPPDFYEPLCVLHFNGGMQPAEHGRRARCIPGKCSRFYSTVVCALCMYFAYFMRDPSFLPRHLSTSRVLQASAIASASKCSAVTRKWVLRHFKGHAVNAGRGANVSTAVKTDWNSSKLKAWTTDGCKCYAL
jgi:hypothetical protein